MTSFVPAALDFLARRKQAYTKTFGIPGTEGHVAVVDLAKFCRAFDHDGGVVSPDKAMLMAGRREAFWRIYNHLNLSPNELAVVYKAAIIATGE